MKPIRRVLVANPYGIGDILFLTPILRALRLIPTVERVDLLLGSRTAELIRSNPHVNEIYQVNKDDWHRRGRLSTFFEMIRLGFELRRKRYDLLLDYSARGEMGFWGGVFLGIPRRAGFDYKGRGRFFNVRVPLPGGYHSKHVVEYFCDLAQKAGVPVEDRWLEFYLEDKDRQQAAGFLNQKGKDWKTYIAVSPGGGESWGKDAHFKRWPVKFFAGFLERLKEEIVFDGVIILGSAAEHGLAASLAESVSLDCLNLAGAVNLVQAAALLEKAAFFLGNDGGLVHLARALDTPLAAFYGPVDPVVYGPFPAAKNAAAIYREGLECRPCYRNFRYRDTCPDRECLTQLYPEEALAILKSKEVLSGLEKAPIQ